MTRLLVTAGDGPTEVRRFVAHLVDRLAQVLPVSSIAAVGEPPRSAVLSIEGPVEGWLGTHALHHRGDGRRRSRWFAAIVPLAEPEPAPALDPADVTFTTTRSRGPGGQSVNTTDSAVIARHGPTGWVVRVEQERSQHANRRLAVQRLAEALAEAGEAAAAQVDRQRWVAHHQLVRGAPVAEWRIDGRGRLVRR